MTPINLRLRSIRTRLVFLALLSALPVLVFSLLQLREDVKDMRADALQDAQVALDRLQTRIRLQLAAAEVAGQLAGAMRSTGDVALRECGDALRRAVDASPFARNFSLVDREGRIFCSSLPLNIGVSVAQRPLFREAVRAGRPLLGDFVRGIVDERPSLVLAVPVVDGERRVAGVAVTVFDAPALTGSIARDDHLVVALLDRQGVLVSRSHDAPRVRVGESASSGGELERFRAASPPPQLRWLDDRERLYVTRPMLYRGEPVMWGAAGVDVDALHSRALGHLGSQLPFVLIVTACVVLVAMVVTRPLVLGRVQGLMEADRLRLQRSEDYYRLLFETSHDGVLATRPTGEILAANAAAERILGRTAKEIVRTHRSQLIPDDDPAMQQLLAMRVQHGFGMSELRFPRPDGTVVDVECWSTLCTDSDGREVTWTVLHDITDRKRAQREIEQLNRELEERVEDRTRELAIANEELHAYSSTVSHDLRAPVAIVRTFAQILIEKNVLAAKDLHHLERIKAAGDHMNELIVALLDLARLGREPIESQPVDLTRLAAEVAQECRDATGRELEVRIAAGGTVMGDAGLLRVVMSNLLANAWKFTRDATDPRVEIAVERHAHESVVTVRDNGAGFDEAYASRMFQPFQRLHSTREFPGLGIGLATVHRIVTRHGGRIWAAGRVGAGAVFRFTLPAA